MTKSRPMFTRRHYEVLANSLRQSRPDFDSTPEREQWRADVEAVATILAADHPRNRYHFDRMRFLNAAGFGQ